MGRALWIFLLLWSTVVMVSGRANDTDTSFSSGAGLFWSATKEEEEGDTLHHTNQDKDDLDGGFSSLDGMLQWAISHSDPAKLKETAEGHQRISPSDLKQREIEIKELMEKIKMPSDTELMKIAIGDLKNSSISLEDRHRALQELLVLVEPIDNANDLNKLGGLPVVKQELYHSDHEIRTIAAWVIGKASQNNPVVQQQVLELGVLSKLMKMLKSSFVEEANKALYAVSALIRNNLASQELFCAEAGDLMLQDILTNASTDIRLKRKAVLILSDLSEFQLVNADRAEPSFFSNRDLLKSLVDLTASTDLDLQEKVLVAIKSLLQLRTTDAVVLKDFCALGDALNRMRQLLHDLMADEYQRDYAMDVESLRREVEYIFHRKLLTQ